MIYYIFTLVAVFAMAMVWKAEDKKTGFTLAWSIFYVYLVLFIGLRSRVGMDWNNYLIHFSRVERQTWADLATYPEWLYYVTMFISKDFGWDIYGSNLIVAMVFCFGLFSFCKNLPNPWMGLMASMPILIFTFAMSANRQAMAAGILLFLYSKWHVYSFPKKSAIILLASFCHSSAIFAGIFLLFDRKLSKAVRLLIGVFVFVYLAYSEQNVEKLQYYGDLYGGGLVGGGAESVESKGAFAHVLINAFPALFLMYSYWKKGWASRLNPLYLQMSIIVLILFPLSFVTSTASARISMYLFPVSLIFFSSAELSGGLSRAKVLNLSFGFFFIALAMFWFTFSNSGFAFVNYKNIMFL